MAGSAAPITSMRSSRRSSVVVGTKTCVARHVRHRVRRKRRRWRPSGPRSSRSRANPQGPSTPSRHSGHRRSPWRSRASTSAGASGTASTTRSSRAPSEMLPERRARREGPTRVAGWSGTGPPLRKFGNGPVITMSVVSGQFVYKTSGAQQKVPDLTPKYSRDKRSQGDLRLRGPVDRSGLGEAGWWTSA